ncbi:MAG TPA: permease-like cell division protein FtsX [Noviherbaspirillum sp.]|uniref:cell division protein FtsX n=1 Tax=Noviherbaspirillum sp. TaxID=1926288 RepID=UPI002DDCC22D|nr:permease-like cell division protein FtsX [Noviherbaspirillum sp.]HEV2609914.1 permease-like cell division protein FtsX [Noviherbaspirillum sp.]
MSMWLRQHLAAIGDAIKQFAHAPGSFAMNVLVIAIALSLPIAGLTLLENVRPVSEQLAVEPEISIFMGVDTPRERSKALAVDIQRVLQKAGNTGKLEFIPRENALSALKSRTGLSDALTTLGENPLPDGYVLKLAGFQSVNDARKIDAIAVQLKALPGVEYVQVDSAWVKRLAALMHVLRMSLFFLASTLAVVVVAVVFNTIRLQVLTQREEIEVCRLFGATDSHICRPFYYSGALLGLLAGLAALLAVAAALGPLNGAIAEFARLYASEFRLSSLHGPTVVVLLTGSAGLGLLGALLSVRRHLSRLS